MNKKKPTVSIILPTYNRAELIEKSIKSLQKQTYQDFEIVVVDDFSKDDTGSIVKKLQKTDKRIRYIKHDKNRGASSARNTGIKASKGKYIAFQDSDDEWLPEKLKKQVKSLENTPSNVGVIYSDMIRINEKNEQFYWHSPDAEYGRIINPKTKDFQVLRIGIQSSLIKKECFTKVGYFDVKFPRLVDMELFLRLSKEYHFIHLKEPLVKYYDVEGISTNRKSFVIARKLLFKKYKEDIAKNKRYLSEQYFKIGSGLCENMELKEGRKYFANAIKTYKRCISFYLFYLLTFTGKRIYNKGSTMLYRYISKSYMTKVKQYEIK